MTVVAKDESIFTSEGWILFPRSDGDPNYNPPDPPGTNKPPPGTQEINYYHVFSEQDQKYTNWCSIVGDAIAKEFNKPPCEHCLRSIAVCLNAGADEHFHAYFPFVDELVSMQGKKWRLKSFPKDYCFTEQRKGPHNSIRTDPYLFALLGHRFRSARELVPHAVWLLLDPSMNPANCACRYCKGGSGRWSLDGATPTKAAQKSKSLDVKAAPRASGSGSRTGAAVRKKAPKNMADANSVKVQRIPLTRKRTISDKAQTAANREQDIMREIKKGQSEGFRLGEVAWCTLPRPVVDPSHPDRVIRRWPAIIESRGVSVQVKDEAKARPNQEDKNATASPASQAISDPRRRAKAEPATFSLVDRVKQVATYKVRLLGTEDKGTVREDAMSPFLSDFLSPDLLEAQFGPLRDHPWLRADHLPLPTLNLLERADYMPLGPFNQALAAFAFSMQACAYMRVAYTPTDLYTIVEQTSDGTTTSSAAPASLHRNWNNTEHTCGARGLGADEVEESMGSMLRSGRIGEEPIDAPHFQGLWFGTERIWVGEVVRVTIAKTKINRIISELAESGWLGADQKKKSEFLSEMGKGTVVANLLRIQAIYTDTRDGMLRCAGNLYEVRREDGREGQKVENKSSSSSNVPNFIPTLHRPQTSVFSKPGDPPMPPVPDGYKVVSMSPPMYEVNVAINHIAGRFYPSLSAPLDSATLEAEQRANPTLRTDTPDHEDTPDEFRARASLAGLLPGAVKAMEVRSQTATRTDVINDSCAIARVEIRDLVRSRQEEGDGETGKQDESDGDSDSDAEGPTELPAVDWSIKTIRDASSKAADGSASAIANAPNSAGVSGTAESGKPPWNALKRPHASVSPQQSAQAQAQRLAPDNGISDGTSDGTSNGTNTSTAATTTTGIAAAEDADADNPDKASASKRARVSEGDSLNADATGATTVTASLGPGAQKVGGTNAGLAAETPVSKTQSHALLTPAHQPGSQAQAQTQPVAQRGGQGTAKSGGPVSENSTGTKAKADKVQGGAPAGAAAGSSRSVSTSASNDGAGAGASANKEGEGEGEPSPLPEGWTRRVSRNTGRGLIMVSFSFFFFRLVLALPHLLSVSPSIGSMSRFLLTTIDHR